MFMRYFEGGIGHQNQSGRWTSRGQEGHNNNYMDVDSDPERDMQGSHNEQLQELRQQALETRTCPAKEDDKDVTSNHADSDDSEDASLLGDFNDNDDKDYDEPYFGPEDGAEGDAEDTGFGDF
jgi:hypothetical protein